MPDLESSPPWAMFTTDDVTKKVAYAYAKQSVFAWLGAFAVVLGASLVAWGAWQRLVSAGGLVLLLGGVGLLASVFSSKDLKNVNHRALRVTLGLGGLLLILALLAHFVSYEVDLQQDLEALGVVIALLTVVSYPLPIKRADSALYKPAEVRSLADRRTLGFVSCAVAALGVTQVLAVWTSSSHADLSLTLPAIVVGTGVVGALLFAFGGPSERTWLPSIGFLAIAMVAGALSLTSGGDLTMAVGLWIVVAAAAGLGVVLGISSRLNQGKTIVGHRA